MEPKLNKRLMEVLSLSEYMAFTVALCVAHDEIKAGRFNEIKWGTIPPKWILEAYKELGL